MDLFGWIVLAFIVLVWFGSKNKPGAINSTINKTSQPISNTTQTGGDTFTSGCAPVSGVTEPQPPKIVTALPGVGRLQPTGPVINPIPIHIQLPVVPPPVATKPVALPQPLSPVWQNKNPVTRLLNPPPNQRATAIITPVNRGSVAANPKVYRSL